MQRAVQLNSDFSDLLRTLLNAGANFLVVGAHALSVHDRARATKDLDVWIRPTDDNARRVWNALASFGAPLDRLSLDDLIDEDTVFQIGVAPVLIDLLTSISGVTFDEAWPARAEVERDGLMIPFIGVEAFLRNKDASGRDQREEASVASTASSYHALRRTEALEDWAASGGIVGRCRAALRARDTRV